MGTYGVKRQNLKTSRVTVVIALASSRSRKKPWLAAVDNENNDEDEVRKMRDMVYIDVAREGNEGLNSKQSGKPAQNSWISPIVSRHLRLYSRISDYDYC